MNDKINEGLYMLIRYKKDLEKIAMGLLSFMPDVKNIKKLQKIIQRYETDENWHLYLWRETDVLGTIGLRIEDDTYAIIQHVSVNPSHRNQGIGKKMVDEIVKKYSRKYELTADELVEEFFNKYKLTIQTEDDETNK